MIYTICSCAFIFVGNKSNFFKLNELNIISIVLVILMFGTLTVLYATSLYHLHHIKQMHEKESEPRGNFRTRARDARRLQYQANSIKHMWLQCIVMLVAY